MNNFIDLIEHATVDELKLRIKSLPFTCSIPSRKAEVVNKLWAAITNPNNVQLIWESLSQVQQLALQEAVHNQDGYMDGFVFYAKYQKAHPSTKNWSGYRARENKNDVKLSPFSTLIVVMVHRLASPMIFCYSLNFIYLSLLSSFCQQQPLIVKS